jgi:predicted dehydrogenase
MRALISGQWQDGYLDYAKGPSKYRVQVAAIQTLERLDGLYFVRSASIRLLINYLREIGWRATMQKVWSRRQERGRNEKFVSWGIGRVLESADDGHIRPGEWVAFLAPAHPAAVERVVLPGDFLVPLPYGAGRELPADALLHGQAADSADGDAWWRSARGWSIHAGIELDGTARAAIRNGLLRRARGASWHAAARLERPEAATVVTRRETPARAGSRPRAVLYGYGNYAKTVILPSIARSLQLTAVHEIDPLQIQREPDPALGWSTEPELGDDAADAVLIAGYHHTHAGLAVAALERGMYAVVEKPLAVDAAQLDALLRAVRERPRLFACFHKRYLPFNSTALGDLQVRPGDPVSYHCIVYEVPLPELHWYRWPNSRSRLVSNGCHWLDHFLYLNDFAAPVWHQVSAASDGTINCSVELENGAFMTMVLTDQGSERIGVQDYIELRANGVTVKMINGAEYVAESSDRILRRKRINKMQSYREMYRTIARKIAAGEGGDSVRSIAVSSALVLALEAQFVGQQASTTGGEPAPAGTV